MGGRPVSSEGPLLSRGLRLSYTLQDPLGDQLGDTYGVPPQSPVGLSTQST